MYRHKGKVAIVAVLLLLLAFWGYSNRITSESDSSSTAASVIPNEKTGAAGSIDTLTTGFICPMHSHITSPHEGKCPICGMDLVPQAQSAAMTGAAMMSEAPEAHEAPEHQAMPDTPGHSDKLAPSMNKPGAPVQLANSVKNTLGLRLAKVARGDMSREIETVGKITRVDSTARVIVSSPVAGKLTFIADKVQGDDVKQGDLLFSVDSDELKENQRNFLSAIKQGKTEEAETLAGTLALQGLSVEQITRLRNGAEPTMTADFYAQKDGFVFIRRGETGDDVTPGFTVFNIGGDKRQIEVTAELFEQQWGWVQEGQKAELDIRGMPGKVFVGTLVRIDPPVGFTTRSLEVRIVFESDDKGISPNVFGRVRIKAYPRHNILMVPSEAVIRTGNGDRVVVVRDDGAFQTMPILVGEESSGMMEVLSGLSGGETVVVSGQFLIDSESSRLADLERLSGPVADGDAAHSKH